VDIVTAPVLEAALTWRHGISADGAAGVAIQLADGRRISSDEPAGVLNRISHVPRSRVDRVGGADSDYAAMEMNALFLSWLEALPGPLVNPPTPQGLCGRWRHPSEWAVLAARVGLGAAPYRQSHDSDPDSAWLVPPRPGATTVFAVGDSAVAAPHVPSHARDGCVRLARLAGEVLLGVDLIQGPAGIWQATGASPTPDLTRGGEPLIDALAHVLSSPARAEALAS
jgi:hypothetical protein